MINIPKIKVGIVAVSRDCFPESLSVNRRKALVEAYQAKYDEADIYECPICIVESEIHMVQALEDIKKAGCNALCVYLGNFGPEISETLLAKHFDGPKMFVAAAEETGDNLVQGRGDAYCGMLNASYNLKLRGVKAYIPEYPVGNAEECAEMLHEFVPIARVVVGLSSLKIISFGPRPLNFLACNAPIQQLYNLGVEIEENSELDLFEAFNAHEGDERIPEIVKEMEAELGTGNKKPEILSKLAQYELTLKDWVRDHKGYREYVAIAGKCWPAFQTQFGFVPCYVNSRLTAQGIPVSCEVDIYGALSEFIGTVVSEELGYELKDASMEMLGRARQVKVTKEYTTIVDGMGDKEAVAARIAQIRAQMDVTTSDFDKEKLQERLAKLSGGVAVIKVGAATEVEMKDKKLRIEDALNAAKAAVEEL